MPRNPTARLSAHIRAKFSRGSGAINHPATAQEKDLLHVTAAARSVSAADGLERLIAEIVRELADATGAEMTLDRASLGGLRVCLRWPAEAPGAP